MTERELLDVRCVCGETFHADAVHAGRRIRCRSCGREVEIRRRSRRRRRRPHQAGRAPRRAYQARLIAAVQGAGSTAARALRPSLRPLHSRDARVRWLARLSWGWLAVACLAWLVLWTLGDRWWPATVFLFGPRWLLLLPLALLVPAVLVLRRRTLLVPLLAALLVLLGPVAGLRVGVAARLAAMGDDVDLRVATLNAGDQPRAIEELLARLDAWHADVVLVQECGGAAAPRVERAPGWHHHVTGQLCLLSRYPIAQARAMDQRAFAVVRESGLGGTSQAAEYVLETPRGALRVANVHLETPRKGLEGLFADDVGRLEDNTLLRAVESRRVRGWLGARVDDLVIAGDFNMPVESAIWRDSWAAFRDAFSHAGIGFGATKDNGWIQVRIDHVLTGDDWRAARATVGPDVGSDHRPLLVELRRVGG